MGKISSYTLCDKRMTTLQKRLGEADDLIDDKQYRPMYRNRQIQYPELFKLSVELSKKKKKPSKYFAKLWGKKQLDTTVKWLTKLLNAAKSKLARAAWLKRATERNANIEANRNEEGLAKLAHLKRSMSLLS